MAMLGLQKQGAVTVAGSEGVTVDGCLFTRLDGNGVFVTGQVVLNAMRRDANAQ